MENITKIKLDPVFANTVKVLMALDSQSENDEGVNYKPLYVCCFRGMTAAYENLEALNEVYNVEVLKSAINAVKKGIELCQVETEDMFMRQPRCGE